MAIYIRGFVVFQEASLLAITRSILSYAAMQQIAEDAYVWCMTAPNKFACVPIIQEGELIEGLGSSLGNFLKLPEAASFADSMQAVGYSALSATWLTQFGTDEGLRLNDIMLALSQDINSGIKGVVMEILVIAVNDKGVVSPYTECMVIRNGNIRSVPSVNDYSPEQALAVLNATFDVSPPSNAEIYESGIVVAKDAPSRHPSAPGEPPVNLGDANEFDYRGKAFPLSKE